MSRSKTRANKKETNIPAEVQNEAENMITNGLTEAIMGFDPGGIGTQISQVDTLYKNNRWYLISNMRQLLSEIYVEQGIVKTIVDVPVDDAFRGGVEISTKQIEEDQLTQLYNLMEREGDIDKITQAKKWNRLYGGAGILILTDQDPSTPLDMESISEKSKLKFRDVDMWELFWSKQNTSDYSLAIDSTDFDTEYFDYYGIRVHRSRVLLMKGIKAPSFIRPRLRGWGLSCVEILVRSINQYLKATDLTFEVLDEFKIDIFKIKGLASALLSPNGSKKIHERVQLANREKNYQNSITMDAEDDFSSKEISFAGISDVMDGVRKQVASDLRMPMTKIFGQSSAGFSSGEDDIENYNSMVESEIRSKSKFHILKMVELRCQQLFGFIPDDLSITFKPLRVLSSEQEENVKSQKFNRLLQALQAGAITAKEFREACNRDKLFPIQLDMDEEITLKTDEEKKEKPEKPKENIKNSSDSNEIACVAITCGDYVLTGQRRDNGRWVFPGGHMEAGETALEAAIRECKEESGLELDMSEMVKLQSKTVISKEGKRLRINPFTIEIPERELAKTVVDCDGEVAVWRWVPIEPDTHELMPESRHARNDVLVNYLLGGK